MRIELNGEVFDNVTELNIQRETRQTEVRYNTQGDMLIDLVNRKYRIEAVFGLLTEGELARLRGQTADIFVRVRLTAPEGEIDEDFHVSNEPAPKLTYVNGVAMYGGVKLVMRQK